MSLPSCSTQSELFSTAGLSANLFPESDRYRLFTQKVYPQLVRARATLEQCYCAENGRTALEPVMMMGVSLLQELDGVPDRQAIEWLRYHAGWNFALNRQLGDPVFHPSSLVSFRYRVNEHGQSALAFTTILEALVEAGLVSRQSRQRLDSTQMFGRVAKPPVQYVDGAYVSAQKLAQAQAEGRELMGPAQPAPRKEGRFSVEDFQIEVEQRTALCPAGKLNTRCSRLVEEATGKVDYRFEFSTQCHDCPLREHCLGKDQRHRTLVVGEHHTVLQARRKEQQTQEFKERMKHRNGIEGTQSELVRGHGLRQARYRGLPKVKLQNYFIGAACNVKRWLRREAWLLQQAAAASG